MSWFLCDLVAKLCLTLATRWNCIPPKSSVHGIFQQDYWSGLPFLSPGDLPDPGIESQFPTLQMDYLLTKLPGKPVISLPEHNWICHPLIITNWIFWKVRRGKSLKEASTTFLWCVSVDCRWSWPQHKIHHL